MKKTIIKLGSSSGITLPKVWLDAHGIKKGDPVNVVYDNFDFLKIVPVKKQKRSLKKRAV